MGVIEISQTIVNGLLLGGVLALVALGFSIVWGIMNIINIAHGAFVMVGAYVAFWLFKLYGLDPFLSVPIAMAVLFVVGYLLQRYLINLVMRAPMLVTFLLTFGLEVIIVNLALLWWTASWRAVTTTYSGTGFNVGGVQVPYIKLAGLGISLLLAWLLTLFMNRTRTGNAIRAVGMDMEAARLMGVNVRHVYALTYGIGAAMAGAAGAILSMIVIVTPEMGGAYTLRAFVICVLGGLGSVPGAMVGGLVFGLVEAFAGIRWPGMDLAVAFAVLVVILIFRPSGIMGKAFYH